MGFKSLQTTLDTIGDRSGIQSLVQEKELLEKFLKEKDSYIQKLEKEISDMRREICGESHTYREEFQHRGGAEPSFQTVPSSNCRQHYIQPYPRYQTVGPHLYEYTPSRQTPSPY